jgi:hypothetical protein
MLSEPAAGAIVVHLSNPEDIAVRTVQEHEPEHFSFQTLIILPGQSGGQAGTGGQAGQQTLLANDPLRKDAAICPQDAPIAICDSAQQASRPWNTVSGLLVPDGGFVAAGQSIALEGTAQVWVSCQTPTRVTVLVNRRRPA